MTTNRLLISIDLSRLTRKLKILTNERNLTQLIKMGNRILVPVQNRVFILKGEHDTSKDALGKN